jgi:hypothetical protein
MANYSHESKVSCHNKLESVWQLGKISHKKSFTNVVDAAHTLSLYKRNNGVNIQSLFLFLFLIFSFVVLKVW